VLKKKGKTESGEVVKEISVFTYRTRRHWWGEGEGGKSMLAITLGGGGGGGGGESSLLIKKGRDTNGWEEGWLSWCRDRVKEGQLSSPIQGEFTKNGMATRRPKKKKRANEDGSGQKRKP